LLGFGYHFGFSFALGGDSGGGQIGGLLGGGIVRQLLEDFGQVILEIESLGAAVRPFAKSPGRDAAWISF
jgi:hypothetical protein